MSGRSPIDCDSTLTLLRKLCHKALKGCPELSRIDPTEQPAERVVTGDAVLQLEKAAQEPFLHLCEPRLVNRALAAAQDRAQSNHQQLMEVMQSRIAGSGVLQILPTGSKLIQGIITDRLSHTRS
jgi:hypothetical protein